MPNKYTYLWVVQGHYGQGWEDLTASTDRMEAIRDRDAYRKEERLGGYRIVQRRERNSDDV